MASRCDGSSPLPRTPKNSRPEQPGGCLGSNGPTGALQPVTTVTAAAQTRIPVPRARSADHGLFRSIDLDLLLSADGPSHAGQLGCRAALALATTALLRCGRW